MTAKNTKFIERKPSNFTMHENPKSEIRNPKSKIIWLFFAAVIVFVYFFGLSIPLVGPDEPRYAQIAREMFVRGDWITPKLGGFEWFEKPALLYWLEIAAYKIFGINEFAARAGSAVFGLGTIFSLWILGKKVSDSRFEIQDSRFQISDENQEQPEQIAEAENKEQNTEIENHIPVPNSSFITHPSSFPARLALIAASSIGMLVFSRAASFDIIVTFPLTAALTAFYYFDQNEREIKSGLHSQTENISSFSIFHLPLSIFYIFVGIALIAKGLIGIVFPFAIVAFYYVLSRRLPSKTFIFSLFWGTILTLLVAAIWYLPMYQINGWKFIDEFIIQHHFQRFTSDKYQHHQPFWFFFAVLPLMTMPWLPFFVAGMWEILKVQSLRFKVQDSGFRIQNSDSENNNPSPRLPVSVSARLRVSPSPLLLFSLAWLLVPLVFFSLSGSKLPGYILPSLPAALIIAAVGVERFVSKSKRREKIIMITAALAFASVIVGLQFFSARLTAPETVKNLILTADAKGFGDQKIVNLYTVSHNLEFYAPGRLIRETDGKLKRYDDFSVLIKDMKGEFGGKILVVVPQKDAPNLIENGGMAKVEILAENGESAIVEVEAK